MRSPPPRAGFTLVEILIVVVIIGILAAVMTSMMSDSTHDARLTTARFNLQTLRQQIDLYKAEHDSRLPSATLAELLIATDINGTAGSTPQHRFGPYVLALPDNPFTNANTVRTAGANPPAAASGAADAGWLYHPATGGLWIDYAELLAE